MVVQEVHSALKVFDSFLQLDTGNEILQDTVRMRLTQALGGVTKPLSDEASIALRKVWSDEEDTTFYRSLRNIFNVLTNFPEWHNLTLKPSVLKVIAQLSSRVFLGEKVCRDPDWLKVMVNYTVDAMMASEVIRTWPPFLRPVVAPFLKSYRNIKSELDQAKNNINPVLEERRREKKTALISGKPIPYRNDAMEWMEQTANGRPYDQTAMQLTLSVLSIHTTSDMTTQAIFDLCGREELVQELQKKIISVLSQEGWKKAALYKLQLMDSFLKESQRMKPSNIVSLCRVAQENIKLNDGTQIVKGTSLAIPTNWTWDETNYENANTFDLYRFLKKRQTPGQGTHAQLVTPSAEHLGWGLGNHACPGRFFAANQMKIFLCHVLLKYDFKLADGSVPQLRRQGFALSADKSANISLRRRHEEIILEDITD
ncbi:hypothetical protein PoHVEF18_003191 [Penicillium ochrochloron]